MRIRTGASWLTPAGNHQSVDVEVDEADGLAISLAFGGLPPHRQAIYLANLADMHVTRYVADAGGLPVEKATSRLKELVAKNKAILEEVVDA